MNEQELEPLLQRMERVMIPVRARHDQYMAYIRHRGNIRKHFVESWTHCGLICGIAVSPCYGLNGYVRLPAPMFQACRKYDQLDVEAHGSLTYGPDAGRFVGFDCGHSGDYWPWREVAPYVQDDAQLMHSHRINYGGCGIIPPGLRNPRAGMFWNRTWSVRQLRAETNSLAEQIRYLSRDGYDTGPAWPF